MHTFSYSVSLFRGYSIGTGRCGRCRIADGGVNGRGKPWNWAMHPLDGWTDGLISNTTGARVCDLTHYLQVLKSSLAMRCNVAGCGEIRDVV